MKTLIPMSDILETIRAGSSGDGTARLDLAGGRSVESASASGAIARFGRQGEYTIRLATGKDDRLTCWHLVYEQYVAHGYAQPQDFEYRYSLHDALPDTATFLVEKEGRAVGTVTVFPDSPIGLPADEMYRAELDAARRAGRRLVEVGRLTIGKEFQNDRHILAAMFDVLSLYARGLRRATDLVITVNPSHEAFYERMLLFQQTGKPQELSSVCGAPAVLMQLDLDFQRAVIRREHGEGPGPEGIAEGRTFYRQFSSRAEEEERVRRMRCHHCPPSAAFIRKYFVWMRPLIPVLPSPLQYFFEKCYPECDLRAA